MNKYYTYVSWFLHLLEPIKIHGFLTYGVGSVMTWNACALDFVSWLWSDESHFTALFIVFKLWIDPGFIFEPCS